MLNSLQLLLKTRQNYSKDDYNEATLDSGDLLSDEILPRKYDLFKFNHKNFTLFLSVITNIYKFSCGFENSKLNFIFLEVYATVESFLIVGVNVRV